MPLHLVKLCVGVESVQDLEGWIARRARAAQARGEAFTPEHVTRMTPKRGDEIRDGGSLYWVIKGQIAARQGILDLRGLVDGEGVSRCAIVLEPQVRPVRPRPMRAFQGWRYLAEKDAPPDLAETGAGLTDMPESLRRELGELGLL
jgi:hypothetical protein